jgi:hypothetical protein
MPRFVILDHDHPVRHWDFLLEAGETLRAWRLAIEPRRGDPIAAEPLPDHRLMYLDYEGPVGNDRGRVIRWDSGTFEWERDTYVNISVSLDGLRIGGRVELRRSDGAWSWQWL